MVDRKPIETFPFKEKASHLHYLLCNDEQRWIRFGKWFPMQKEWYYSGTNERSQYTETVERKIELRLVFDFFLGWEPVRLYHYREKVQDPK